jgi:two-component system response regulator HydG
MKRIRHLIGELASSSASVLIQGETGTGKENIARALHAASGPPGRPFVALNCAAMPAGLLESELFGYARGAFTDATTSKKGLLVEADGGTLLLDEIGDLPLALQPKLLRAIQERCVRPLGTRREVPFNCRLMSAANQDLELAVKTKRFREDLYYRLDVVRITVPPLRVRGADILLLAEHFLARFARNRKKPTLSQAAQAKLLAYHWPGNVRELENCVERALALTERDELTPEDLPQKMNLMERFGEVQTPALAEPSKPYSLFDLERSHVLRTVTEAGGNRTRAAEQLGIDRRTLQRRLRRYEADPDAAQSGNFAVAPESTGESLSEQTVMDFLPRTR